MRQFRTVIADSQFDWDQELPKALIRELDCEGEVEIVFDYEESPPEPDVGWDGGIELERARWRSLDIIDWLTEYALEQVQNDVMDYEVESYDAHCDFLLDKRKGN
jgi:hypothetical protein